MTSEIRGRERCSIIQVMMLLNHSAAAPYTHSHTSSTFQPSLPEWPWLVWAKSVFPTDFSLWLIKTIFCQNSIWSVSPGTEATRMLFRAWFKWRETVIGCHPKLLPLQNWIHSLPVTGEEINVIRAARTVHQLPQNTPQTHLKAWIRELIWKSRICNYGFQIFVFQTLPTTLPSLRLGSCCGGYTRGQNTTHNNSRSLHLHFIQQLFAHAGIKAKNVSMLNNRDLLQQWHLHGWMNPFTIS